MMLQKAVFLLIAVVGGADAFATWTVQQPPAFCRTRSHRKDIVVFASSPKDEGDVVDRISSAVQSAADKAKDKVAELIEREWDMDFEDLANLLDKKARASLEELNLSVAEETDFRKLVASAEAKAREAFAAAETVVSSDEVAQLKEASKVAGAEIQKRANEMLERYGSNQDMQAIQQHATEEIVSILKNREYGIADLFYLLRLCTSFGLGMNPVVMSIFPLNVLIQLYNFSLIQEGGRGVLSAVSLELDKRARRVMAVEMDKQAKTALFGDADIEVGTLFKKALQDATGKAEYKFGDLAQNLLDAIEEKGADSSEAEAEDLVPAEALALEPIGVSANSENLEILDAELVEELETLDEKLQTSSELDNL